MNGDDEMMQRVSRIEGTHEQVNERIKKADNDIADLRSFLWKGLSFGILSGISILVGLLKLFLDRPPTPP